MKKKLLTILLSVLMVATTFTMNVFAEIYTGDITITTNASEIDFNDIDSILGWYRVSSNAGYPTSIWRFYDKNGIKCTYNGGKWREGDENSTTYIDKPTSLTGITRLEFVQKFNRLNDYLDGYDENCKVTLDGEILSSTPSNKYKYVEGDKLFVVVVHDYQQITPITEYNVNAQVQGSHGTAKAEINNEEISEASEGDVIVFTATPEADYEFYYWEVVSGGIELSEIDTDPNYKYNNVITVTMPDTALTLKAHFREHIYTNHYIIVEDDGHGTAKAQVNGTDVSGRVAPNTDVTLIATANEGYVFKEWQIIRGLEETAISNNTFKMPSNEVKVKAIFERVYNINLQTNGHGTLNARVAGQSPVTYSKPGVSVVLVPEAETGYVFDHYEIVSGTFEISDNSFTMPSTNVTIKAIFTEIKDYQIIEGDKVTINTNKGKDVLFRSNADYSKFVRVEIDDVTVDSSNYTVSEGSTKVTLKASYLKTLTNGAHTLSIVSTDGKADTTFTITRESKPTPSPKYVVPNTGVN